MAAIALVQRSCTYLLQHERSEERRAYGNRGRYQTGEEVRVRRPYRAREGVRPLFRRFRERASYQRAVAETMSVSFPSTTAVLRGDQGA